MDGTGVNGLSDFFESWFLFKKSLKSLKIMTPGPHVRRETGQRSSQPIEGVNGFKQIFRNFFFLLILNLITFYGFNISNTHE